MTGGPFRRALALFALLLWASGAAQAARPWYEEYETGLRALRAKRAGDAIAAFENAARQRPAPGRNVQTYGTNFLADYQPYLKLAEACLLIEDTAAARLALERGLRYRSEPAAERERLREQVEAIEARVRAARATPTPSPSAPPVTTPELPPVPVETPTPAALDSRPAVVAANPMPARVVATPSAPPVVVAPSPRRSVAVATASRPASLAIALSTTPPGANVYLDDTLIGTTDPTSGRLRVPGVARGMHRLRVSLPGHADVVRDVEAAADGALVEIALEPRPAPVTTVSPPPTPGRSLSWQMKILAAFAAVVLLLWFGLRRRAGAEGSLTWTFALPGTPGRPASGRTPALLSPERTPGGSSRTPRPFEAEEAFPIEFGDYTLLGRLGRGGMAIVYDALRAGEPVALKRPLSGFQEDPRFLERFLREAEIGRTLHHPNVIRILERGEVDGVPFFTMERIEGETLGARLRRLGALPEPEVRRILLAVAEALDYGHSKGVVHRDLKPSNVLLAHDGPVKVTDYGIARARRFEGLTATGAFLGSPDYAAPEMIEGQPLDARADLYALGVMAYEMLAGRRPFEAEAPFAVLRLHVSQPPRPLRELAPQVSAGLEAEVMKLLAKAPAERHADAEALLLRLRAIG